MAKHSPYRSIISFQEAAIYGKHKMFLKLLRFSRVRDGTFQDWLGYFLTRLMCAILAMYALYATVLSCYWWNGSLFWIYGLLLEFVIFFSLYFLNVYQQRDRLLIYLTKLEENVQPQERKMMKVSYLVFYVVCTVVFLVNLLYVALLISSEEQFSLYSREYYLGLDSKQHFVLAAVLTICDYAIARVYMFYGFLYFGVLYLVTMFHLSFKFDEFRKTMQRKYLNPEWLKATDFVKLRDSLCNIVDCLELQNTIFFYISIMYYCFTVLVTCTAYVIFVFELETSPYYALYYVGMLVMLLHGFFSVVAGVVFFVDEKSFYSTTIVHALFIRQPFYDVPSLLQADLLLNQIETSRNRLKVANFFEINRPAVLRIHGAMFSFVLSLIQLRPELLQRFS